jgi:hypothetical protein
MQSPQFTQEMSRFCFLGATFMKQALSQPLQSVHEDILAVSIPSLRDRGLIHPKSICMSPAAQMNLQSTCRTRIEVTSM